MFYTMNFFIPEIIIFSFSCFVLVFNLFLKQEHKHYNYYIIQCALAGTILVIFFFLHKKFFNETNSLFLSSFILDKYSLLLKFTIIFYLFCLLLYTKKFIYYYVSRIGEYYFLISFSVLGMLFLVSSNNLLIFYLSLELISLPIYALVAMVFSYRTSAESSLKYFVLGSIASGILLFGISLVYGSIGFLNFQEMYDLFNTNTELLNNVILQCGYFFILCGLFFKLGVAPFHIWVPDIYKGSSIVMTLFISTVPKISIFGICYKFIFFIFYPFYNKIFFFLISFSILSLFIGNIFALVQSNIKRMFAYSSITNVGFILLSFLCFGKNFVVSFFYLFVYLLTTLGSFAILLRFSNSDVFEFEELEDFRGLGLREPFLSCVLLIFLLSMAGLPPLLGFYAKLLVLNSILSEGFIVLAIFSVLMTVIGLFFYLRVVKLMFFDKQSDVTGSVGYVNNNSDTSSKLFFEKNGGLLSQSGVFFLFLNSFFLVVFGFYPQPLLQICSLFSFL